MKTFVNNTEYLGPFTAELVTAGGSHPISSRYYQVEAVQSTCSGLANGGRGQLRSACGTGKTMMALRAAELLCPTGGILVVVCPSIGLVAQTLREAEAVLGRYLALAVCSDGTVRDAIVTVEEIPATVTTSSDTVSAWLAATDGSDRLRVIVGTHASAHVIGGALSAANRLADLLVIDEAHQTAGYVDKRAAVVHDDNVFPAKRRLYATATPKIIGEKRRAAKASITQVVGMNDAAVFGKVFYRYPFSQAIDDGYLDDYRLVVMGVTRAEVAQYLAGVPRNATSGSLTTSLHTAMVQTVLAKAAREYGFRRSLVFCRRLNEAGDFARTMNTTLSCLPEKMKPRRRLTTGYVHGRLSVEEREGRLALLAEPPGHGWAVVTNVQCLTEGVNVPTIDAVAFTYPKQSVTEIVQAVGRALRRDPEGTGVATIVVPILLPDDPADFDEADVSDYRLLWQVIRALRAHDDRLGATIDRADAARETGLVYDEKPIEHLLIDLPDGYDDGSFLQHLTARIITAARSPWWDGYTALAKFHNQHGHTAVPRGHVVDEIDLGAWADRTRAVHRQGRLALDRVAALEELGFDLQPRAVEWAQGLRAATTFFDQHGHLEPTRSLRVHGVKLHAWLEKQRILAQDGELADRRRAALDALKMRWHNVMDTFDDYLEALQHYRAQHGHINIPPDPDTPDGRLGSWLVSVRIKRKRSQLTAEQMAALNELGMSWTPHKSVTHAT